MAEKGPVSTPFKRIEGDPTGALRSARSFPFQSINLQTANDATPAFPTHGLSRASIILSAGTIGTAVVDVEASIDGNTYKPLEPRLKLTDGVPEEYNFDIGPWVSVRARVSTLDGAASANATIKFYAFNDA